MCSIFGMGFFGKDRINSFLLRGILRSLALNAQARGRDATGLAFTTDSAVNVFKHNVSAKKFIELENFSEVTRKYTNKKTNLYSILGHCRAQTLGTHTNPLNNHPITTNSIVGVHNGMIGNHNGVFNILNGVSAGYKVERAGQVDSEAIFRAIDLYAYQHKHPVDSRGTPLIGHVNNPVTKAIQSAAELLSGSFTCAAVDTENPECLWIFKHSNPVTIYLYENEGFLAFASLERFLKSALEATAFSTPEKIELDEDTGICFNLVDGSFSKFNLREKIGQSATTRNKMNALGY